MELKEKYRILHEQGWMPIFVKDNWDALLLAEACVAAGARAVEVTCRRPNATEEISRIKRTYPGLLVLAGSVVEEPKLHRYLARRRPDAPTVGELADAGVDGFVAQLPFSPEMLGKYSRHFICIPGVETLQEGVQALRHGAHFVKYCSATPLRISQLNSEATHRLLPIFYTGGASLDKIPAYIQAGAAIIGGGWDLMLQGSGLLPGVAGADELAEKLAEYLQTVQSARRSLAATAADEQDFWSRLDHYHPFTE